MSISTKALLAGATALVLPVAALAQAQPAAQSAVQHHAPAPAAAAPAAVEALLPANTEVVLTLNDDVSSKSHRLADKFSLSVAQDVTVDGHVVVARGTRAVGQVTKRTGRGGFGKSGKMDVAFRYLDVGGKWIPLDGRHHQDGESKTAATVGAVLAAGVIGGLIVKGKSARMTEGREVTVRTAEAVPVMLPATAGAPAAISARYTPMKVSLEVLTDKERKREEKARKAQGGK